MRDIGIVVGGIIPHSEQEKLKEMGVAECFGSGTSIESIVKFLSRRADQLNSFQNQS
jgi:methylmalonyl-CoA mutase C-terminal domain/subunit